MGAIVDIINACYDETAKSLRIGRGRKVTLLAATTIIADDAGTGKTPVTGLDGFATACLLLTVSAKSLAGGGLLNLYVQYSPDEGVTWDDLASLTQITAAAVADGKYVLFLNARQGVNVVDRVVTVGTLGAASTRQIDWADRLRVYTKAASFGVNDTVTIKIEAYLK